MSKVFGAVIVTAVAFATTAALSNHTPYIQTSPATQSAQIHIAAR
jgi:hypothetical protein